jgi:hypothetical protein
MLPTGRQRGIPPAAVAAIKRLRAKVPRANNRTGLRTDPWPTDELPHFVAPLPNPTLAFDAKTGTLTDLDPQQFQTLNSSVVLFAPHLFWPGLVEVRCPLCRSKATAHGWSTSIRKITGLFGVWYLNGARYKCIGCSGELRVPGHGAGHGAASLRDRPPNALPARAHVHGLLSPANPRASGTPSRAGPPTTPSLRPARRQDPPRC